MLPDEVERLYCERRMSELAAAVRRGEKTHEETFDEAKADPRMKAFLGI